MDAGGEQQKLKPVITLPDKTKITPYLYHKKYAHEIMQLQ